jgi:hypothetical protein
VFCGRDRPMRKLYLLGAVLGTLLPYYFFVPFVLEHGLNVGLLLSQLFVNRISAFFGVDVIVSSLVLWLFIFSEGRRLAMRNLWLYVVCNLLVGVSLALPLFLYVRQGRLEQATMAPSTLS